MSSKGGTSKVIGCALMAAGGLLVACMGLIWAAYTLYQSTETQGVQSTAIRVGAQAPDFTLVASSGGEHQLSSYAGKVVLLNFWTTWCGPCESEMPDIERLSARYPAGDVVILAINNEESIADVAAYGKKLGLTFPLLLDLDGNISDLYRVRAFPTSIVVDRQGLIHKIHVGSMDEEQFMNMLDGAVAEPPGME